MKKRVFIFYLCDLLPDKLETLDMKEQENLLMRLILYWEYVESCCEGRRPVHYRFQVTNTQKK